MLKKILIANRGEIACRVIKTARRLGIATVAVYSDADRDALHVELADEVGADRPGAEPRVVPVDGQDHRRLQADRRRRGPSGLRLPVRERGASRAASRRRASSSSARSTPRSPRWATRSSRRSSPPSAGVSTIPGPQRSDRERRSSRSRSRSKIGYPVMIKASAGGGGKGLRVACERRRRPRRASPRAATRPSASFGDDRVFIEKFVEEPRHIEIQVLGDAHGNCVYLWERECSIQRRHQKVVEEAPSPFLDDATQQGDGRAGGRARQGGELPVGRHGRVRRRQGQELLLPRDEHAAAGRAPGHRVRSPGLDLVEQMIRVAAGETLAFAQARHRAARLGDRVPHQRRGSGARLPAEHRPAGRVPPAGADARRRRAAAPAGTPGVRVDTGVYEGGEIADPLRLDDLQADRLRRRSRARRSRPCARR